MSAGSAALLLIGLGGEVTKALFDAITRAQGEGYVRNLMDPEVSGRRAFRRIPVLG